MSARSGHRSRRFAVGVAGWVFGLASTVLLVGVWGRAMVIDTDQLAESLTPLAASEAVAERIADWLEAELVESGVDGHSASVATDQVLANPRIGSVLEQLVAEGVDAAASPDPGGVNLDVAAALLPATDQITTGLNDAGVPVTTAQVEAALAQLDPLVIREASDRPFVGASSPLASNLGTAAMLGAVLMLLSGSAYVAMSKARARAVRSLLTRFALGALSFAVLLRIGSWLVDPKGGRAPFRESFALLADAKWDVPLSFGLVTSGAAVLARMWRRRVRLVGGSRPGHEPPIRQQA